MKGQKDESGIEFGPGIDPGFGMGERGGETASFLFPGK